MQWRSLVPAFLLAALSPFCAATPQNQVVIGTPLAACFFSSSCPNGGSGFPFILPGEFLAQSFILDNSADVSSIHFTVGVFSVSANPDGSAPVDYPELNFQMQLTTAIGADASPSSVLATHVFTLASTTAFSILSFPIGKTLSPGTYYLVVSTSTPIPNATQVIGWGEAGSYFPNIGEGMSAVGVSSANSSVWELMTPCTSSDCLADSSFPAGSSFAPVSGPAQAPPFQFEVNSTASGKECGNGEGGDNECHGGKGHKDRHNKDH